MLYGVFGIVVVYMSVVCLYVTDVLWLSVGSQGKKFFARVISPVSKLAAHKI